MKLLLITPYKKHDYLCSGVIEGLKQLDVELYCTDKGNGAINIVDDIQAINVAKSCDRVLAFFSKNRKPSPKYYILDTANVWHKTAYIDGSEYNYTAHKGETDETLHPDMIRKVKWYFKRECTNEHIKCGVIPFPFCAVTSDFGKYNNTKEIDIVCSFGQTTTGLRRLAIESVNELSKQHGYNVITNPIKKNYLKTISKSWITIDAHGGGECNARMWQILANNSYLMAQRYNIKIPNLHEEIHYSAFEYKNELKDKLVYLLNNKSMLRDKCLTNYDLILNFHTSKARAKQLLDRIK